MRIDSHPTLIRGSSQIETISGSIAILSRRGPFRWISSKMELSVKSPFQHVTWKIQDFFQLPSKTGYCLVSPEIKSANDTYSLQLYPNGIQYAAYIVVRLTKRSVDCPDASYKVGYRQRIGKEKEINIYYSSSYNTATDTNEIYFKRESFHENRDMLISDGTLTLLCLIPLGKQSIPGSQFAKTKLNGLPECLLFSSCSRLSKMELSIESPYQHVTWKVPDFFNLMSKIGYCLNSTEFYFANDKYCLRFYPKGGKNGDTADTDLQLVRLTSSFPEKIVLYKIGYRQKGGTASEYDTYHYSGKLIDEFGFCLSRSELERERDKYFQNDTFTVLCSMCFGEQSSAGSPQSTETGTSHVDQEKLESVAQLQINYMDLLLKGAEYDACLVVSGKEIRAHRLILRARSVVFDAMFGHDTAEKKTGRVVIDDLNPHIFRDFLEYLYTGAIRAGLSGDNVFELYATADKYDVPTLKSECVAHMRSNLSVDSFCDVFTLARRYCEEDLMQLSIKFFKDELPLITASARWQQFVTVNGTLANWLLIQAFAPRGQ